MFMFFAFTNLIAQDPVVDDTPYIDEDVFENIEDYDLEDLEKLERSIPKKKANDEEVIENLDEDEAYNEATKEKIRKEEREAELKRLNEIKKDSLFTEALSEEEKAIDSAFSFLGTEVNKLKFLISVNILPYVEKEKLLVQKVTELLDNPENLDNLTIHRVSKIITNYLSFIEEDRKKLKLFAQLNDDKIKMNKGKYKDQSYYDEDNSYLTGKTFQPLTLEEKIKERQYIKNFIIYCNRLVGEMNVAEDYLINQKKKINFYLVNPNLAFEKTNKDTLSNDNEMNILEADFNQEEKAEMVKAEKKSIFSKILELFKFKKNKDK